MLFQSKQLSPRITASYKVMQNLYLNGSAGLYYQLPAYTALGYRNNEGELINTNLDFMRVTQGSLGLSWNKGSTFQISLEGFIKKYGKMPLCVEDNIPLACKGDDYGVIGNELLVSTAAGRSYGAELLARWFIASKLNLSASFTLFKSEYQIDSNSSYIPSAWDNRYIVNLTGTYDLPQNWSVGLKFNCIGGSPYTPYDIETSSLVSAWDAQGQHYYD